MQTSCCVGDASGLTSRLSGHGDWQQLLAAWQGQDLPTVTAEHGRLAVYPLL